MCGKDGSDILYYIYFIHRRMNILITGGAGYIGSHVLKQLLENTTHSVTVVDNLSTGRAETIKTLLKIRDFTFKEDDLSNVQEISNIIREHEIQTILHFAASIVVPESVENPLKYYTNNTVNAINLIRIAQNAGVRNFIFSSTAAAYGEFSEIPSTGIDETTPLNPINPYGASKVMVERVLMDTAKALKDFRYTIFRYFNVAGADMYYQAGHLKPRIGQSFPKATHLIKIAAECALGKREKVSVFGTDFPTKDGSGVRDYIHVDDLASAHIRAIDYLQEGNSSEIFNLGYGKGYSVLEVINTMQEVSGVKFNVTMAGRRAGDPAKLIADNSKYVRTFSNNKEPIFRYNSLPLICESAFEWEKQLS